LLVGRRMKRFKPAGIWKFIDMAGFHPNICFVYYFHVLIVVGFKLSKICRARVRVKGTKKIVYDILLVIYVKSVFF
jgi:hypothetical protein